MNVSITTKKRIVEFSNALDAYLNGETVQFRESPNAPWKDASQHIEQSFAATNAEFRVKPEPVSFIVEFRNGKPYGLHTDDETTPRGENFKRFVEAA